MSAPASASPAVRPAHEIPAAPGLPVLGNTRDLMTTRLRPFLTRGYRQYGPVFTVTAPGTRMTVLAGPEANLFVAREGHRVLRSHEAWNPNDREMGAQQSLISTDGPVHRAFRRVEGRAYSRSYFGAGLRRALAVTAEDLSGLRAGDTLPVADWCKAVVTEQLARVVVNGTARPHLPELLGFVQTALQVTVTRQLPAPVLRLPGYRRARAQVMGMVDDLIAAHRGAPPERAGREPDLIDDVLAAQREDPGLWGEPDVRMAALGAFIAGMDTAANSLAFVLYRLHRHPELLPPIQAEVDALFADGPPTAEALGQAAHLHRFVMETLRLHPIAPALTRTLTQDVTFGGFALPAGGTVLIATTVPHGLEECFRDPDTFDPSRFGPGRAEHRRPGAYAPFGVGTHICAGSGMAEGLILLNAAAALRTLDLHLGPDYVLREVARPTPSPDHRLTLQVRGVRHPAVTLLA